MDTIDMVLVGIERKVVVDFVPDLSQERVLHCILDDNMRKRVVAVARFAMCFDEVRIEEIRPEYHFRVSNQLGEVLEDVSFMVKVT